MKKLSPALVFSVLGIATFASLVGTVSGTLAWYAYNTRTSLSYSGTSVENSVQLQIGLASTTQMAIPENGPWSQMTEVKYDDDPVYYYFAPLGQGLDSTIINYYLGQKGYATTRLCPVTSGYYDPTIHTSPIELKAAPTTEHSTCDLSAEKTNFLYLPFVFRASNDKTTVNNFLENKEIWLTDAKGAASSSNPNAHVYKALRVHFNRNDADYASDFIVNPDATVDGQTKVGGLLDLTCDGLYDFDENGEIFYGEWDKVTMPNPSVNMLPNYQPGGESPIYDLNNDGSVVTKADTFKARHHTGTSYYDYAALNSVPIRTAKYSCLDSIKPKRSSEDGHLENLNPANPTSVCKTANAAGHCIGRVDATIWLEGWDFSVIDEEEGYAFDFGLTFEINRAGSASQL